MRQTLCGLLSLCLLVSACAHRGAVRVKCEGPLRSINAAVSESNPVSVDAAPKTPNSDPEKKP